MIITQILMTVFVIFALSRVILRFKEGKISIIAMFLWAILWVAVEIVIWIPDSSSQVAKILGIGRGADLIIYGSLVATFYLIFRIYVKLEDIERQITALTRKIALKNIRRSK